MNDYTVFFQRGNEARKAITVEAVNHKEAIAEAYKIEISGVCVGVNPCKEISDYADKKHPLK